MKARDIGIAVGTVLGLLVAWAIFARRPRTVPTPLVEAQSATATRAAKEALAGAELSRPPTEPAASARTAAGAPGPVVRAWVRDERGALLFDAAVVARGSPDEARASGIERRATRRPDGAFVLSDLDPGAWELWAERDGRRSKEQRIELAGADLELELVLVAGVRVLGQVLAPDGRPDPEARVVSYQFQNTGGGYGTSEEHECGVDEQGRFALADLDAGTLTLRALSPGHAPSARTKLELEPGAEQRDVVLQLLRAARVTGELCDAAGAPLPAETVVLRGAAAAETLSDEQGHFVFGGLAPGTYSLARAGPPEVESSDRPPIRSVSVMLAEGEEKHVVLGAPASDAVLVRGQVTLRGAPVAAAQVKLQGQQ